MNTKEQQTRLENSAGPHEARTKDNPIGIDDIGLPSGIQSDEAGKLDQIKPDPAQAKNKS